MIEISILRLLGIVFSLLLISIYFYLKFIKRNDKYYPVIIFGIFIFSFSVFPNILEKISNLIFINNFEYSRTLTALFILIGLLIFSFVYVTLKIGNNKSLIDKLITQISYDNSHLEISSFKEIMILIPAFNEGDNLKKLLPTIPKKIQDLEVGILVIDDGSEDDTGLVAKEFNAIVVKNIINRGQGSASKLGYKFLKDFKVVSIGVTMDADNQHRAEDIEALISPIIKGNSDLVIGSRMLGKRGGGSSLIRFFGIISLSKVMGFIIGQRITDCSSGFKAFSCEKYLNLSFEEEQYQAAEILIKSSKGGLRIKEVPIQIDLRLFGETKKGNNLRYGFNFIKAIVKSCLKK